MIQIEERATRGKSDKSNWEHKVNFFTVTVKELSTVGTRLNECSGNIAQQLYYMCYVIWNKNNTLKKNVEKADIVWRQ